MIATADLMDKSDDFVVAEPIFRDFGGKLSFCGQIQTVKCFEDNSLVRETLSKDGTDKVLIVDGAGSLRVALLGDMIAKLALDNGWQGVIVHGCIRDSEVIGTMPIGVKALATNPRKSQKKGMGEVGSIVSFAGVNFIPNQYIYADCDGIVITEDEQ